MVLGANKETKMSKYPRTKDGMAKRRNNAKYGISKHRPGLQFNPENGEPHTASWLAGQRKLGLRRPRQRVTTTKQGDQG